MRSAKYSPYSLELSSGDLYPFAVLKESIGENDGQTRHNIPHYLGALLILCRVMLYCSILFERHLIILYCPPSHMQLVLTFKFLKF
jgi:hypothetical protein